jgi:hypothetical protein
MSDLMPKINKNKNKKEIENQLEILDSFREMIKNGEIDDFIAVAMGEEQSFVMINYCPDIFFATGMLEKAKMILLSQPEKE